MSVDSGEGDILVHGRGRVGSRSFVLVSMVFGERECTHGNGE